VYALEKEDEEYTPRHRSSKKKKKSKKLSLSLSGFSPVIMDDDTKGKGAEDEELSVGSGGTDIPAIIHALQEDKEKHTADWDYFDEGPIVFRLISVSEDTAETEDVPDTDGATSRAREEDDLLHIDASWMRKYYELKVSVSARGRGSFIKKYLCLTVCSLKSLSLVMVMVMVTVVRLMHWSMGMQMFLKDIKRIIPWGIGSTIGDVRCAYGRGATKETSL